MKLAIDKFTPLLYVIQEHEIFSIYTINQRRSSRAAH